MLFLRRKLFESIRIGNDIQVKVTQIGPGAVRLGIEAPREIPIIRSELCATANAVEGGRVIEATTAR